MKQIVLKCKYCNNEFVLSEVQSRRYAKNPNNNYFCSKSCSAKYRNENVIRKNKERPRDVNGKYTTKIYDIVEGICENCGKEFKLTKTQQQKLYKDNTLNVFCSKSCSAKYSNAHRDNSWKEQAKITSKLLYGEDHYVNKEQISKTIKKLYKDNNNYGFNSIEYIKTLQDKYGVDNISKSNWMKSHNIDKYGTEYYFQSNDYKQIMTELYSSPKEYYGRVSKYNKKIIEELDNRNIKCYVEKYIEGYYYDIGIDNTLLEVNPTITHNAVMNIFGKEPLSKDYHKNKSQIAKNNGYRCIHIFDWDNIDKILDMVADKKNIYARKCKIVELDDKVCKEFIDKYHIQGNCNGYIYRYGLLYDNELVQVMTFGKPRYSKKYEYELLRLCTHKDYKVIGGASKLFKYFINEVNPNSIISYCDMSKFNGDVYINLGLKLYNISEPVIHWYNNKTHRHITDNLLRQRGFSQLHNDKNYELYSKGMDNYTLMLENGYMPVYDCGQATYTYNKE